MLALATHEPHFYVLRERVFIPNEEMRIVRSRDDLQQKIQHMQSSLTSLMYVCQVKISDGCTYACSARPTHHSRP